MKDFIKNFITGINSVADHVWAIVLVALGSILALGGHHDIGQLVVGGGLALFKGQQK
jgi:hypothetical protein